MLSQQLFAAHTSGDPYQDKDKKDKDKKPK